jgi:predicted DNA-binding helix-hairpin-helix protein
MQVGQSQSTQEKILSKYHFVQQKYKILRVLYQARSSNLRVRRQRRNLIKPI